MAALLSIPVLGTACARPTLDEGKAAAALRGHPRFAQPIVIGLPLEPSERPAVASAIAASEVLMARGDLIITQTEPFYVSLTSQGQYLIGTAGWTITEARAVRTLSVPVARRELLDVEVVQPSEGGGLLAFDWRWSMTDVGLAFRLAGVRLEDWGLRIDDGHTFKGGAQLTLAGDRWDIRITRPPSGGVD